MPFEHGLRWLDELKANYCGKMKILAYVGNISFAVAMLVALLSEDTLDGKQILIFVLFFALPVVNLFALAASAKGRDFFSLYFEHKRLEQEQKIIALKKSMGKDI